MNAEFRMSGTLLAAGLALLLSPSMSGASEPHAGNSTSPRVMANSSIDAGRYLVVVGGCNDCHTANWAESFGSVAEQDWLTGTPVGFRGPWGTTYASNLRLLVQDMDEEAWVTMLRVRTDRPPMPWVNLNQMDPSDARAIFRFIRSLGARGERAPTAVAADVEPTTPYILFEPLYLERLPLALVE